MTDSPNLTVEQADDFAARVLAGITESSDGVYEGIDRYRVASDLAGLRQHLRDYCEERGSCADPCPDIARYMDGLRRTAALYRVAAPNTSP